MIQKLIIAFICLAAVVAIAVAVLLFTGPRMRTQPNMRTFEAALGSLPTGTVMIQTEVCLPTPDEAATATNPLPATAENIQRGRVYYQYYCTYCHGATGAGDGLVGQSYVPRPADLRKAEFAQCSDAQLLRASLLGVGHEPVLERVVLSEHWWYLMLYVRTLQAQP